MNATPPAVIATLPRHPKLDGMVVTEVLRNQPGRHSVYAVEDKGRKLFVKVFHSPDAADLVRDTEFNLKNAAEALGQAENAVANLRFAVPEAGALVIDAAQGTQLTLPLAAGNAERRAQLIARAGGWLAALTAPRERAKFGPGFWMKELRRPFARSADSSLDHTLLDRHLCAMQALADDLRDAEVERAYAHGDFTPDNLYLDGPRLYGIDMQRPAKIAIARDAARFLVWLQSRRTEAAKDTRDGVSAAEWQVMHDVPGLLSPDQDRILRFMIGELLGEYYLSSTHHPLRRAMLAQGIRDWDQAAS